MSFLTGSPAKSSNQAYGYLQNSLGGDVTNGNNANNALAGLLGVGGDPTAAASGYQNFLNSSGYQNVVNSSNRGVTDSAAARGLLQSGSTLKALQSNSANLGQNYFSNYLSQLGGLSSTGLQAGSVIGGAGQQQSGATGGLLGSLGGVGSVLSGLGSIGIKA